MSSPIGNLRVLDDYPLVRELDLASEVFHRINRIIPQNQVVLSVPPKCRVREAVEQMRKFGYSQVPVVDEGAVLGVFSFRSLALGVANESLDEWLKQKTAPGDLQVDEFIEKFAFARVTEEISSVFDAMGRDNGVLIGTPDRLIGVLTPIDFLRYLYQVASPFVLVSEIELALRALIGLALTPEKIIVAAQRCLSSAYGGEEHVPALLEDMTFDNYQTLISHGENWKELEPVFGGNRTRTSGKLKEIGKIRNDLFHFKREITMNDHETLSGHREWLLNKIRQVEARRKMESRL